MSGDRNHHRDVTGLHALDDESTASSTACEVAKRLTVSGNSPRWSTPLIAWRSSVLGSGHYDRREQLHSMTVVENSVDVSLA